MSLSTHGAETSSTPHYWPPGWHSRDGRLQVAGRDAGDLAEAYGTPLYAYDAGLIRERIEALRTRLPGPVRLSYAVKANPMPELLSALSPWVDGMDVASGAEMHAALAAGQPAGRISLAGPAKPRALLEAAIEAGAVVGIESARQLELVGEIAAATKTAPELCLRLNPDFRLRSGGMRMSGGPSPFGVDAEAAGALLERARALGLRIGGYHVFAGSQCLDPEALAESHRRGLAEVLALAPAEAPPAFVNLGGGLGIPYSRGDEPLELGPVAEGLEACLAELDRRLPGTALVLELGRYLVGEAGVYLTRVVDRKVSRGRAFLVTDGGMHHHLAASGNLGQAIRKDFPLAVATRLAEPAAETPSVVGPLCTPLDLLADRTPLPRAEPGDLIAIFQSGAYGLTASPTGFLSHPPPAEVLL
nr:pyridoxal-dependent decarboxylase, exosortase A system-associated [Halorhodospira neutriphila]